MIYEDDEDGALKAQQRRREEELDDVRILLRCPSGKRFFSRLLNEGKIFSTTFSSDSAAAAFLEGHRNLALKIFNDVLVSSPELVAELLLRGQDIA